MQVLPDMASDDTVRDRLARNLAAIRQQIAEAALRCGRQPETIKLVAVTKYVGVEVVRHLVAVGCHDLGESRPQELWQKAAATADLPIRWHLVGHLQRNKVRRTLPLIALLHSLDSLRLAEEIDKQSAALGRRTAVLLEVNTSGEAAKHGLMPEEVPELLPRLAALKNLEIRGLMCMAALEGGMETARTNFAALRTLRDRLQAVCPPGVCLEELSMGMSGDYQAAIAEGATIVRIGSALFEGIAH